MAESFSSLEIARRLQQALSGKDSLSCAEAEELLAAFVMAESAGEDVEHTPTFGALLAHFDHCTACLDLYEQMADSQAALIGEHDVLPMAAASAPNFFAAPIPKGDYVLLQVLKGMIRRFELSFDMPLLRPAIATMSGQQRILYSDTVREIQGSPLLALSVGQNDEEQWLQIAIRDSSKNSQWQLSLDLENQLLTALTDSRGIARFVLPKHENINTLRLICEEIIQ